MFGKLPRNLIAIVIYSINNSNGLSRTKVHRNTVFFSSSQIEDTEKEREKKKNEMKCVFRFFPSDKRMRTTSKFGKEFKERSLCRYDKSPKNFINSQAVCCQFSEKVKVERERGACIYY